MCYHRAFRRIKHLQKLCAQKKRRERGQGCSGITVDDLKDQLQRHEGLLENLTISIGNLDNFSCKNTFFKLLLQPTCIQIIALLVRTRAAEIVVE